MTFPETPVAPGHGENGQEPVSARATGIDEMGRQFADKSALSIPDTIVRRAYVAHREAIETAMVGTQLLGVRIATLARFTPLLLLLYAAADADGLTQRAIRKACGGRESASLYHRAKYLQLAALGLGGLAIIAWPEPVEWQLAGALLAGAVAVLARGQHAPNAGNARQAGQE